MKNFEKITEEMEQSSIEESRAINKMLIDAIKQDKQDRKKTRRISIICATISLVSLLLFAGILAVLASGIQVETTTTTETVSQDTEGIGNNVYQSCENATYSQGEGE